MDKPKVIQVVYVRARIKTQVTSFQACPNEIVRVENIRAICNLNSSNSLDMKNNKEVK